MTEPAPDAGAALADESTPEVSVLVAAQDARDRIGRLLTALRAQTLPAARYEVIVADDGSRDGMADEVERVGGARLVRLAERRGAYAARNAAFGHARGSVIAITDSDCQPAPDWLEEMLAALGDADMVGGRIEVRVRERPTLAELVDASRHLDQERYVAMGFAAFANFACHRETIDAVGGFNQRLVANGDRELCLRAGAAGRRLVYAPRAVVVHEPLRRPRDVMRRSFRMGVGRAHTARHGQGPARERRRNWLPPREYLPAVVRRDSRERRRLAECGVDVSLRQLAAVDLASYALVGVPVLAGRAVGALDARRR